MFVFDAYRNPEKAEAVWEEYFPDLERSGLVDDGHGIAAQCSTARELGLRLDRLVSYEVECAAPRPRCYGGDADKSSLYGRALRILEESR